MLDREPQGGAAAERVSHHVDRVITELLHDHGEVVADIDEVDRTVAQCRPAMPVEVDGDDLPSFRERGQNRREHSGGSEAAVQQE